MRKQNQIDLFNGYENSFSVLALKKDNIEMRSLML